MGVPLLGTVAGLKRAAARPIASNGFGGQEKVQATAVLGCMLARHCELLTNAAANRTIMPGHIEVLSQDYASPVPVQRAAGLRPEQRLPG